MKNLDQSSFIVDEEDIVNTIIEAINRLEQNFSAYETNHDYTKLYSILHEYCYNLIGTEEEIQVFSARHGFTAVLNNLIRNLTIRKKLTQDILQSYLSICREIESWETLSEFFLNLPWFIEKVKALKFSYPLTANTYINEAIKIIQDNLTNNDLTVFWLASQLGITTTHLNNLFKAEMDQTVSKFINQKMIEEITYELSHNRKSLKEVRKQFGFTSSSHFSQFFKRQTGLSPLAFVKKQK